ncbi:hypothetical protein ACFWP7_00600 [Streptomyces sp. NPDC058470]|uniref:hypothetical protein n=1 Tax=Streptomyces sp. NPDC058470 TaxID=3346515 RepID=UPI00364DB1BC
MRALPARRIASSALCATLLLGIAAPVAVAADSDSARGRTSAAAAPVPGADALLAQVQSLADIGGVLKPVTDLLDAVLKADNGQLSADQAATLGQAVKDAIAKLTAAVPVTPPVAVPDAPAVPATPALPATPAAPAVPAVPALPAAPALPAVPALPKSAGDQDDKAPGASGSRAAAPADLKADALAALQKAVDTLLAAVTSGDPAGVVPAATAVVTGLVNLIVAVVLGGGLPVPDLPGLPSLSSLPAVPAAPAVPAGPALPAGGLLPS